MTNWQLALADKHTAIQIEIDSAHQLLRYLPMLKGKKVLILTDSQVAPLYLDKLTHQLINDATVFTKIVAAGEPSKNLDHVEECYRLLIAEHFTRQDYLVCLGGGMVGDLGALIASTYMRGIQLVQVPTTIVAQSDSSIGGKTAIDYHHLKNLIGTFYPAQSVLVDPQLLLTLPQRELAAGLVEVIKSLLISERQPTDQHLLARITPQSLSDVDLLAQLVTRGLQIKSHFAAIDFYDFKERRYLNFGHTIGHAVEALAAGELHHGEAVSIGLITIMRRLVVHQDLPVQVLEQTQQLLLALQLPIEIPTGFTHEQIMAKVTADKKASTAGIQLVLLHDFGQPYLQTMTFKNFQDWLGW
ncbi:3-dehydroquinate synthase [Lapidilactobacillus bayanensis]|uniref:3-dehydroquinate synthase n=1 Tax=Lapidilactobacillus bayanensis TaxID=2485998 RepID=UPI000F773303|nr:3-dehydroquinate synthase [Lapidilactobacillus bayanensis]